MINRTKDYRALLVQEHQTLVQSEDAKQTTETTIQEALLEDNRNELSESSSEKRFEIPLEKAEETSVIILLMNKEVLTLKIFSRLLKCKKLLQIQLLLLVYLVH
ncbi:hypothetical protein Ddye_003927 [Dipteronia dyeriana]|uniref:Uncharacterized protein n=1 Tax=Dipteronia dyeriana TaxID=168575 RepID=A0AAE0CWG5_9ROSI|nr:hypothetical protein Ddye_003927 [Dipteronia dyeriana]